MRSATTGLRLCGIADEPFWPRPNGSITSRTSVRARCRTSVANRSSDDGEQRERGEKLGMTVARNDLGCGRLRARGRAARKRAARPRGRRRRRRRRCRRACRRACPRARAPDAARSRSSSNAQPASFAPKVVGSAWTPCVRPTIDRGAVLLAPADDAPRARVEPGEDQRARLAHLERERGVEHVGRRETVVQPAPGRPDLLGYRVDEGRDVVLRRRSISATRAGEGGTARRARTRPRPRGARPRAPPRRPCAASSTSSQCASLASSDQIPFMAGRE